ncbi:hypothetical protein Afil01_32310 [Actinorhabdospora filicis]|uniref:Uncharacterized protein n=1 Tax=Actinorhabdospora filicis TaxID=1785913 RepID=A0A9W6W9B5_9ACTN|nr:hypothetical protein [Actinorhabdospora filicis]GLZ78424.1 hypothetical protein Afil01_32310 [Actinorhabdospora filicis]
MTSLRLQPALRLLAHLAPARAVTVYQGELPPRHEWAWAEPPLPAALASPVPRRFALAVDVIDHATVEALLPAAYPGDIPEIARELLGQIASMLADGGDLARVTVAAEPGGPALDELHLASRDHDGGTRILSLTAPATAESDPVRALADAAEVLGEYVWLNNNERLEVTVRCEDHGLAAVTDAAFRTWWPTSQTAAGLLTGLWDEEPGIELLDDGTLAAFAASFTEDNLANARGGAWAAELIGDYDIDDDPQPRFPGDRLVELLSAELFERAAALAGSPGLVHGLGLPEAGEEPEYGVIAAVVFTGPGRVVTLAISAGV